MPKWFQHKGRQHNDFLHILVNLCCAVCWKRCPLHFGYFTKAHSHSAACLLSSHTLKPTHTTAFCRELCMCVLYFAFLFFFWESVSEERKCWRRESAVRTLVAVAAFKRRRSLSLFKRPSFHRAVSPPRRARTCAESAPPCCVQGLCLSAGISPSHS